MQKKNNIITVQDIPITVTTQNENDYISITDIASAKTGKVRAADVIKNWLRNRTTLEFLGTWEQIYNDSFKVVEFDHFKREAGLHTFTLSVSEWIDQTNAIGLYVKKGRYGGTFAHKDIAFEFASAISPVFKLYLIKEFQRLKEQENDFQKIEWNAKRFLSKNNYLIQTDAVKNYLIPKQNYSENLEWLAYAKEADVLSTLQVMQDYGVNLICIEDGIDSSKDAGKLMISVLSAVAEIERENIRVQTMEGRAQKAREGKWNGGFATYGYMLSDGYLVINEEEAEAIRTIFDRYVNTEMGANGVAKYLENHGIKKIPRANGKNTMFDAGLIRKTIKLTKKAYTVEVGKTTKVKAKVKLVDKNKKHILKSYGAKFRYKTSDSSIATVSKSGKIKGIKKGTCTIYVYAINGKMKKAEVTVK